MPRMIEVMNSKPRNIALWQTVAAGIVVLLTPIVFAQSNNPGSPVVYHSNSSSDTKYSNAYIDASAHSIVGTGTDFCVILNSALQKLASPTNYPNGGGVIDARGLGSYLSTACSQTSGSPGYGNPWSGISVPSTVLLPAGTIKINQPWTLPSGTRLIGQGGEDPGQNLPNNTSRTWIQAQSQFGCTTPPTCSGGYTDPIIRMGAGTPCTGVTIENVVIDAGPTSNDNSDINGIDNPNCGDQSYVRNVTFYRIKDIGLNLCNLGDPSTPCTGSANSGPYVNITFDPTQSLSTGAGTVGIYLNVSTRGVQGVTCTTGSANAKTNSATGTCVTVSAGNTVEDVRVEGFTTGVIVGASNTVLMNVDGDTNPHSTSPTLEVVQITGGKNIVLLGITNNCTVNGTSNYCIDPNDWTIEDLVTNTKIQVSTDPFVAMYVLGDKPSSTSAMYSRYTTSPNTNSTWGNPPPGQNATSWSFGSGAPANPCAAGSLYSDTHSGDTFALYVCSAVSGAGYQKWAGAK